MKSISKTLFLIFGLSLILSNVVLAEDPKPDAVAAAIEANTKAVEANTKAVKDAAAANAAPSTTRTVAEATGKAGIAWVIFKIGDGILKVVTKGPGMILVVPTNVLKQMTNPGGSTNEAMMISDEPVLKTLEHFEVDSNKSLPPTHESKLVAI